MSSLPPVLRLPPHRTLLPLGPGRRVVGLDPAVALAVDDLSPPLAGMLDELARPTETLGLVTRAVERGADLDDAQALLLDLVDAGALIDAAAADRRVGVRTGAVAVVSGNGPLAVGIVIGLRLAGIGTVHVDVSGTIHTDDLGTGLLDADLGRDRLDAIRAAVRRLIPGAGTGPPPLRVTPDLVVCTDAAPDPVRVAELHAAGTAHLAVRLRDGTGIVGPLVLPGRSTCLRCLELHRSARDADWPVVAAGLVGRVGRADPATAVATTGLATAQSLAAIDTAGGGDGPPPALDATLEIDATAATLVRRSWSPASECGCGATSVHGGARHGPATSGEQGDGDTIRG